MPTLSVDPVFTMAPTAALCEPLPPQPAVVTLRTLIEAYLQEYEVRQFRINIARCRVTHLRAYFGDACRVSDITTYRIRQYQVARRQQGAAAGTINRETSALTRMFRIVMEWGWLEGAPLLPGRLREGSPRQGFFEHEEYQAVRDRLPSPFQDVLDFAYFSGWRKHEILDLVWDEVDLGGGVVRLSPHRSKTREGRLLPLSPPLLAVLQRRLRHRRCRRRNRLWPGRIDGPHVADRLQARVRCGRIARPYLARLSPDGRPQLHPRGRARTRGDDAHGAPDAVRV
jgi:integrase